MTLPCKSVALTLALSAAALSAAALSARAQTPTSDAVLPPAPPSPDAAALADVSPPAPAARPAGTTVPGVTVTGKHGPTAKCAPKDKACVLAVAKLVWDQYPEQTKLYCQQEKMRSFAKRANLESIMSTGSSPFIADSDYMPPALEVVCDYGAEQAKAKAAADKPAP
jgi:hypothetical protein